MKKIASLLLRAIIYGGASTLLLLDIFFLIRALLAGGGVPVLLILAGMLTAAGLLIILYAEGLSRQEDKEQHHRLAQVAHQLMTPLRTLITDIDLLQTSTQGLPTEAKLHLKRMDTKTKDTLSDLQDLLFWLQLPNGKIVQEKRVHDLCVLVKQVIEREKIFAQARNCQLVHQFHCQEAPVQLDRRLFNIALTHLVENAIIYSLTPGMVNLAIAKHTDHVRVTIQDRGIGVSATDQTALWQPFMRGQSAARFEPHGLGLGVVLARTIIHQFGGQLTHQNRTDSTGSIFTVKLPLAASSKT